MFAILACYPNSVMSQSRQCSKAMAGVSETQLNNGGLCEVRSGISAGFLVGLQHLGVVSLYYIKNSQINILKMITELTFIHY